MRFAAAALPAPCSLALVLRALPQPNSTLVVYVDKARGLGGPSNPSVYVKTFLKSQLRDKSKRKTKVVPRSHDPVFAEVRDQQKLFYE